MVKNIYDLRDNSFLRVVLNTYRKLRYLNKGLPITQVFHLKYDYNKLDVLLFPVICS